MANTRFRRTPTRPRLVPASAVTTPAVNATRRRRRGFPWPPRGGATGPGPLPKSVLVTSSFLFLVVRPGDSSILAPFVALPFAPIVSYLALLVSAQLLIDLYVEYVDIREVGICGRHGWRFTGLGRFAKVFEAGGQGDRSDPSLARLSPSDQSPALSEPQREKADGVLA